MQLKKKIRDSAGSTCSYLCSSAHSYQAPRSEIGLQQLYYVTMQVNGSWPRPQKNLYHHEIRGSRDCITEVLLYYKKRNYKLLSFPYACYYLGTAKGTLICDLQ